MTKDLLALLVAYLTGSTELAAIVGTRIYPVSAPQGVKRPFISYQIIDSNRMPTQLDGTRACNKTGTVQIDCWAHNLADCMRMERIACGLIEQMESDSDADLTEITSVRPLHDNSGRTPLYRASIEAEIHYS